MISVVAARYAKALADVVTPGVYASSAAQADPAEITAQLRAVDDMIESSSELKNALASPAVAPSRKRAVMARLIAPLNVSAQVRNFLFVVIDHRRVQQLKSIVEAFENLADERLGFVRADVASAHVAVGALVLVTSFVMTARAGRLYWSKPVEPLACSSQSSGDTAGVGGYEASRTTDRSIPQYNFPIGRQP